MLASNVVFAQNHGKEEFESGFGMDGCLASIYLRDLPRSNFSGPDGTSLTIQRSDNNPLTNYDSNCIYEQLYELAGAKDAYRPLLGINKYKIKIHLGSERLGTSFDKFSFDVFVSTTENGNCVVTTAEQILDNMGLRFSVPFYPSEEDDLSTIDGLVRYILRK